MTPKQSRDFAITSAFALTANKTEEQKRVKATRISVGIDTALRGYQAACKIDNSLTSASSVEPLLLSRVFSRITIK
jgi:hypothetical protein